MISRQAWGNMSKRLISQQTFLELLLKTEKQQARALMDTITQGQLDALIEIFINLMTLKVPPKTQSLLRRRRRLLSKLTNKRTKVSTKLALLRRHFRQIYDTLLSVKDRLLGLLR